MRNFRQAVEKILKYKRKEDEYRNFIRKSGFKRASRYLSNLADEKRVSEQMALFTPDAEMIS